LKPLDVEGRFGIKITDAESARGAQAGVRGERITLEAELRGNLEID
jgi:hypothetical protein